METFLDIFWPHHVKQCKIQKNWCTVTVAATIVRAPRWTFTDPCKPEVRPCAREESASPAWRASPRQSKSKKKNKWWGFLQKLMGYLLAYIFVFFFSFDWLIDLLIYFCLLQGAVYSRVASAVNTRGVDFGSSSPLSKLPIIANTHAYAE